VLRSAGECENGTIFYKARGISGKKPVVSPATGAILPVAR
jgi:hypothetical protein